MKASKSILCATLAAVAVLAVAPAAASAQSVAPAPAAAFPGIDCNPMASVDNGVTKVADGRAECLTPDGTTVGVTVALYVDGVNLGSSYRECMFSGLVDQICEGTSVARAVSGEACARVGVTYTLPEPDGFQQRTSQVGNGCP